MMEHIPKAWRHDFDELRRNRATVQGWLDKQTDPWMRQRLTDLVHDHDDCLRNYGHALGAIPRLEQLRRARRVAQHAADRHARRRPASWRVWRHRAWRAEEARRWTKLARALVAEQDAACATPAAVQATLAARVKQLGGAVQALAPTVQPSPTPVSTSDPATLAQDIIQKLREKKTAAGPRGKGP